LGTGERALEIDRLKAIGPIFDCGTVGLGSLPVRAHDSLTGAGRVKLEPPLPSSVNSLFTADPHDVGGIAVDDFFVVFANKHGVALS